ncbi:MAG: hypothetical protein IT553_00700 [Sphingomonadaceae bacterium]|nr:hypothetical protein [Sphingomonadaceae bacterium]
MTANAHWAFVAAAYAITYGGSAALLWHSWRALRRAESAAPTKSEDDRP